MCLWLRHIAWRMWFCWWLECLCWCVILRFMVPRQFQTVSQKQPKGVCGDLKHSEKRVQQSSTCLTLPNCKQTERQRHRKSRNVNDICNHNLAVVIHHKTPFLTREIGHKINFSSSPLMQNYTLRQKGNGGLRACSDFVANFGRGKEERGDIRKSVRPFESHRNCFIFRYI